MKTFKEISSIWDEVFGEDYSAIKSKYSKIHRKIADNAAEDSEILVKYHTSLEKEARDQSLQEMDDYEKKKKRTALLILILSMSLISIFLILVSFSIISITEEPVKVIIISSISLIASFIFCFIRYKISIRYIEQSTDVVENENYEEKERIIFKKKKDLMEETKDLFQDFYQIKKMGTTILYSLSGHIENGDFSASTPFVESSEFLNGLKIMRIVGIVYSEDRTPDNYDEVLIRLGVDKDIYSRLASNQMSEKLLQSLQEMIGFIETLENKTLEYNTRIQEIAILNNADTKDKKDV